jgi:hypothetical protein
MKSTMNLNLWCLTPLSAIFQLYHGDQLLVVEEAGGCVLNLVATNARFLSLV